MGNDTIVDRELRRGDSDNVLDQNDVKMLKVKEREKHENN